MIKLSIDNITSLKYKIIKPTIIISLSLLAINIIIIAILFSVQGEAEMEKIATDLIEQLDVAWDYVAENQDLINYTLDGEYEYKGFHCAIVAVDMATDITNRTSYVIRYVREDARSNMNIANLFEQSALEEIGDGAEYVSDMLFYSGQYSLYYVEPMYIEESCLECHGEPAGEIDVSGYPKEGLEIGDVYGAVAVIIPAMPYVFDTMRNIAIEVIIFAALIATLAYAIYRIILKNVIIPISELGSEVEKIQDGDFDIDLSQMEVQGELGLLAEQITSMASQLNTLYTDLEGQVELRTEQLSEMNTTLQNLNIKLADESDYKSEFLAMMSHELKTPLTSIIAFTDILQTKYDFKDEVVDDILVDIGKQGQVLLKLINDILEMSKIEAGKFTLIPEVLDCSEICYHVAHTLRPLVNNKQIDLKINILNDLPLIIADRDKLRQMFENLVQNAIKFTDIGGKIQVDLKYLSEERAVKIVIADNGMGIGKTDIPYVFDKFYQVDSSNARVLNGSGLGLALVKNIVDIHGGEIELHSELGVGTMFTIKLFVDNEIRGEQYEDYASR